MLAILVGWGAQCAPAWAADDAARPQLSIGLKVWNSSWSSYLPGVYAGLNPATGASGLADSIDAVEGERKTTTLPVIAVRSGNYVMSASYAQYNSNFRSDHSAVVGPNGDNLLTARSDHLERKESDVTLAYFLTPNVALSAGLKYATEGRDTTLAVTGVTERSLDATAKGLIIGALANFQVHGGLRFYGQFGYGPTRVSTNVPNQGKTSSSASYLISEIGLNYALAMADPYVKGASVGLGYRSQVLRTNGVGPAYGDERRYRDTKDGLILSLTVAL